jgi:hypothetical protein
VIASDASFADDEETRKYSQGYIILLFGGPVVWKALRQSTILTSITEAKMVAFAITTREVMAFHRFSNHPTSYKRSNAHHDHV